MENLTEQARNLFRLSLTPKQQEQFALYEKTLLEWNQQMNLTAITNLQDIRHKHFLDSMSCSLVMNGMVPTTLIDVGTGAGFPGIVLKILFPAMKLTLVESVQKKVEFCNYVVERLHLSSVECIVERAETLGHNTQYREQYDCAVARAVASLPTLVEYLLPFVKIGGIAIALKGNHVQEELLMAKNGIYLLGGKLKEQIPVLLPGEHDARNLIVMEKIRETDKQYPRLHGVPVRNPL